MNNELLIRFGCFSSTLLIMAVWEMIAPRRKLLVSKKLRWLSNIGILILDTLILRAIFPLAAVGAAAIADQQNWGLFNFISLPYWQSVLLSVISLDLMIYCQHVMFHKLPILWQLHKVHHADRDFDLTTGLRFHPLEILLSMAIKITGITLLGAPVIAVMIFEILLNSTALFNHSNINLSLKFDHILRWAVVTPDMHRIHHSVIPQETNSNFGFNIPWWDYLFGTYRDSPVMGHEDMEIGLSEYQQTLRVEQLPWMLILPFLK
ncbi:sterol desaturase family protein [Pseudanabaena biceps]|nr:sterol desaturase family protein [Pseudanabaena biceps]